MSGFLGPLQEIYNREDVSEIIVDRIDDVYWEQDGKVEESENIFSSEQEIFEVIDSILNSIDRKRDSVENGYADLRLRDGSRVAITLPPVSINGPTILIRKMPPHNIKPEDIIKFKYIDEVGWELCDLLMKKDRNVLLAGNAGCGKTTMANLLIGAIHPDWRVVTAEKVAELETNNRKRTHRLETPTGRQEEFLDLLQKAGKLRADYIVVNELKGAETFEAIKLMKEGYAVLATIMAEAVSDALKHCELYCLMGQYGLGVNEIKYHIASGIDVVIFTERLGNGQRVVSNISSINGINEKGQYDIRPLYVYREEEGDFALTLEGKKILAELKS
jgi:pilus assembly protein CpaF